MKPFIRACGAALLLWSVLSSALAATSLAERVAGKLRDMAPDLTVEIASENQLTLTGGGYDLLVNLERLRALCDSSPKDCDEAIETFARGAVESAHQNAEEEQRFARERLFAVLRPEGFLPPGLAVTRPFVPGLVIAYVIDSPETVEYIKKVDLEGLGLTQQELHAATVENLDRLPPIELIEIEEAPGVLALTSDDGLVDARALDPILWDDMEADAGGPIALAFPARNLILLSPLNDRTAMNQMRQLVAVIAAEAPDALSPVIFTRRDGGWVAVGG